MCVLTKSILQISSVLIGIVFLTSCTSRQWVTPGDCELYENQIVYGAVLSEGGTLSFAGDFITDVDSSLVPHEATYYVNRDGGLLSAGTVFGILDNGIQVSVELTDISKLEIDKTSISKTIFISLGAVVVTGSILYLVALFSYYQ